ncbi:MAG: penicillin-binding protein 2, partial [Candidatus Eisenbacteria bacterium]
MTRPRDVRLPWVLAAAGCCALLLLGRAGHVSLVLTDEYRALAEAQHTNLHSIPAPRGPILDRHGRTLACSVENPSLAIAGGMAVETERLAADLCRMDLCTPDAAARLAVPAAEFRWITRRWVPDCYASELAQRYPSLRTELEMKRFYPAGPVAPQLLGAVGTDGRALSGLEISFDEWLSGTPGRRIDFVTGAGRPQQTMPSQILCEAEPGGGLVLAIDARVDEVVRFRLREGMERIAADKGIVIALDPWTGEILAMCGEPCFDPLAPDPIRGEEMKICGVMDQFEPGSVFKVNTFTAALESGLVAPEDMIDCHGGTRMVAGRPIRDLKKMGRVTAAEVLIYSSNIGNGVVAETIGRDRFLSMAQAFGFGQRTGIPLAGEATGKLPHPLDPTWSARTLLTMAYGQEVAVTALQMALAYAAVANGGLLMKPLLV